MITFAFVSIFCRIWTSRVTSTAPLFRARQYRSGTTEGACPSSSMVEQKHSWSMILEASWWSERLSMWILRISTDLSGAGRNRSTNANRGRFTKNSSTVDYRVVKQCECASMRCSLENNAVSGRGFFALALDKQKSTPSRRVLSVSFPSFAYIDSPLDEISF